MDDDNIKEPEVFEDMLLEYSGHVIDPNKLSNYDRASMTYFTDSKMVRQPRLHITISLDITKAHRAFLDRAKPEDTFTAYLTWGLLATIQKHPRLSWRQIDGVWYAFDNLPLFLPVTSGLKGDRLVSVLLKDITGADWDSFSSRYNSAIQEAREEALRAWSDPFADQLHWSVYHVIGNLPAIQFTGLILHESGFETTRPMFYFGHRHQVQDDLFVPFAVQFHHATFDPVLLTDFLADFQKQVG
jgi:chloramphenicol O-acetyltransferase